MCLGSARSEIPLGYYEKHLVWIKVGEPCKYPPQPDAMECIMQEINHQ
jgi:hypothetical protein